MDDMDRCSIPTPFAVGRVNCYLFVGNGLTLVDPGPATAESGDALEACLDRRGFDFADVDRILITHPHMDHFGIAHQIAAESGAEVLAHTDAAPWMADPIGYFERERAYFAPYLVSMGMPDETVDTVLDLPEPFTDYQDPVDLDRELAEGDSIDVGVDLECVHTPGHAPGSVSFLVDSADAVLTGDHVLPDVTPNPLLTLAPGSDDERTRSLPTYLDSLRKLLDYDASLGYPGHGEPMSNLAARIHETIDHHEERKERIAGILESEGPTTAYQIVTEMFPDLPATELYAGMSEVIGHLDLLEDEQRVCIRETDGVLEYELDGK